MMYYCKGYLNERGEQVDCADEMSSWGEIDGEQCDACWHAEQKIPMEADY